MLIAKKASMVHNILIISLLIVAFSSTDYVHAQQPKIPRIGYLAQRNTPISATPDAAVGTAKGSGSESIAG